MIGSLLIFVAGDDVITVKTKELFSIVDPAPHPPASTVKWRRLDAIAALKISQ